MEYDSVSVIAKCEVHEKPKQKICNLCKSLLCTNCANEHKNICRGDFVDIFVYAEKELVPKYNKWLDNFERNEKEASDPINDFVSLRSAALKNLLEVKTRLESSLDIINRAINSEENYKLLDTNNIKRCTARDSKKLESAIRNKDLSYIIMKLNDKTDILDIGDNRKRLIETLNKTISHLKASKELKSLDELVQEFNSSNEETVRNAASNVTMNYVYGLCKEQMDNKVLCQYDIRVGKLVATVSIPRLCSIVQVENRVFISGGWGSLPKTTTDKTSEFIEESISLVAKKAMKCSKNAHAVQPISRNSFVTVGGWHSSP